MENEITALTSPPPGAVQQLTLQDTLPSVVATLQQAADLLPQSIDRSIPPGLALQHMKLLSDILTLRLRAETLHQKLRSGKQR